jgi:hypothetical protein
VPTLLLLCSVLPPAPSSSSSSIAAPSYYRCRLALTAAACWFGQPWKAAMGASRGAWHAASTSHGQGSGLRWACSTTAPPQQPHRPLSLRRRW